MSIQKCQKCESPASHKFTRIIDGHPRDFYFCQRHAAEFSPLQQKSPATPMNLKQLFAGLLKEEQGQKTEEDAPDPAQPKCRRCGLTYNKYRRTMLLGCSDCYEAFAKPLAHDLRRYHGTVRHCGRQPETAAADSGAEERIDMLEARLELAIGDEDFELAAKLRDRIRELKSAGNRKAKDDRK